MSDDEQNPIPDDMHGENNDEQPIQVTAQMLLIVVGAHLRAEMADRPLAYRLRDRILQWQSDHDVAVNALMLPVVCSDIWFVNQKDLQHHPVISLGGPGVNALSAYFTHKLEAALVQDDKLVIQLDPELVDLRACVWGMDHALTVQAIELFDQRYLENILRAVATQVEPSGD